MFISYYFKKKTLLFGSVNGWVSLLHRDYFASRVTFARGDILHGVFLHTGSLLLGITYCTTLHLHGDIFARSYIFTKIFIHRKNFKQLVNFKLSFTFASF